MASFSIYRQYWAKHHKLYISSFILFWLYSSWLLIGRHCFWQSELLKPIQPLFSYWGFAYTFAVFDSKHRPRNRHVAATVTFNDGTTTTWQCPSSDNANYLEQFINWRFRKLVYDCLDSQGSDYKSRRSNILWSDFARYVARSTNKPNHYPASVRFIELSSKIPLPAAPNTVTPILSRTPFVYHVRPGEL